MDAGERLRAGGRPLFPHSPGPADAGRDGGLSAVGREVPPGKQGDPAALSHLGQGTFRVQMPMVLEMPKHSVRTQKTTPKGKDKSGKLHEPIEIPVPKRKDFEDLLRRSAEAKDE